jgi:hypothetical protein
MGGTDLRCRQGHIHKPSAKPTIKPETRDALLAAIAKARAKTADPGPKTWKLPTRDSGRWS